MAITVQPIPLPSGLCQVGIADWATATSACNTAKLRISGVVASNNLLSVHLIGFTDGGAGPGGATGPGFEAANWGGAALSACGVLGTYLSVGGTKSAPWLDIDVWQMYIDAVWASSKAITVRIGRTGTSTTAKIAGAGGLPNAAFTQPAPHGSWGGAYGCIFVAPSTDYTVTIHDDGELTVT